MSQFLKQTFASLVGTIAAVLLMTTVGIGGLVFLLFSLALQDTSPKVEDKSFLVFDLSIPISDRAATVTLGQALSNQRINRLTLRNVVNSIDKASKDDRIIGIFLDGRNGGGGNGYATLEEIYQALERFKASGKKIIAYDVDIEEREYYLTSLADRILLHPMGGMEWNGLASEQLFLTGAMKKYGIGVQVVRVGEFKAAVEPFIRQNHSPENREQLEALLGGIWADFLSKVSKNRQIPPAKLQNLANTQGVLGSEQAETAGLVDKISYFDEATAELQTLTGKPAREDAQKNSFRQISLVRYVDVPVKGVSPSPSDNKVGIVYAEGTIVSGRGRTEDIAGESFAQILRKIRQDKEIKAVVLRINSPGGSATASDIILREVQLLSKAKPTVVSMGDVAASGGYWIATGVDRIFASPNTVTGSIGVFGLLLNIQDLSKNNGLAWDTVQTSPLANLSSIARPKTPQELAIVQQSVNQVYDRFLDKVATARNLPKKRVAEIGEGRVWLGKDAKKINLVDEMGGLQTALNYVIDKAKLGDDWEIVEYPQTRTLEEQLLNRFSDTETWQSLDPLTQEWLKFSQELEVLRGLDDPKGVYTRLPFFFQFR